MSPLRKSTREEKLYWRGLRDALVHGARDPGLPERGLPVAEEPYYRRGFDDGERAVVRIRGRDDDPAEGFETGPRY